MNLSRLLKQTATYWGSPLPDGYGGSTFALPRALPCRWENRVELFTDTNGDEAQSQAIVYLATSVEVGGFLYLGDVSVDTTTSTTTSTGNTPISDAWEIKQVLEVPDVKGQTSLFKVYL